MKALIIGCGYLGKALGRFWVESGMEVVGWIRSPTTAPELVSAGIQPFIGDVASTEDWQRLTRDFQLVVHCASSNRGGAEAYRSVYLDGLRQALRHLPSARLLFVSSTSVYGQNDGSEVHESSPASPTSETSRILRETEELALRSGAIVLRVAGIYGPDRGVLFRKFLAGQAVMEGDGTRLINQVHRDDIVSALHLLSQRGQAGEIYNVVDDQPCSYQEFYQWLSSHYQLPFPPPDQSTPTANAA